MISVSYFLGENQHKIPIQMRYSCCFKRLCIPIKVGPPRNEENVRALLRSQSGESPDMLEKRKKGINVDGCFLQILQKYFR